MSPEIADARYKIDRMIDSPERSRLAAIAFQPGQKYRVSLDSVFCAKLRGVVVTYDRLREGGFSPPHAVYAPGDPFCYHVSTRDLLPVESFPNP